MCSLPLSAASAAPHARGQSARSCDPGDPSAPSGAGRDRRSACGRTRGPSAAGSSRRRRRRPTRHEQAAARVVVLRVHLQVLGQLGDPVRHERDLHLCRSGVRLGLAELRRRAPCLPSVVSAICALPFGVSPPVQQVAAEGRPRSRVGGRRQCSEHPPRGMPGTCRFTGRIHAPSLLKQEASQPDERLCDASQSSSPERCSRRPGRTRSPASAVSAQRTSSAAGCTTASSSPRHWRA